MKYLRRYYAIVTMAVNLSRGVGKTLYPIALFILSACLSSPMAHAAGVVGICDEPHLLAAVAGGGSVTFSCSGVINLSNPVLINSFTVIDGGGTITLSGGPGLLFVNCNEGGSCPLTVRNLTLQNASQSAIYNVGQTVLVSDTVFLNNHAGSSSTGGAGGGIYCDNTSPTQCFFDVRDSYFEGNSGVGAGGAIYNPVLSFLLISNSTFVFNDADRGGAIYNEGYIVISNSTFTDNGLNSGSGGNLYFAGGFDGSTIRNSTLNAGRAAAGSAGNIFAAAAAQQGSGSLTVIDTIMANPGGALSPGAGNCSGPIVDGGGNLQWPASGLPCVGTVADPKLGILTNNGGPTTTLALLPGSAAIDKGVDATCTLEDQRHVLRPQGPHCDIGAFEANTANTTGQSLLQVIGAFLPALSKNGTGKMTQQVIGPLSRSLDAALWQGVDGNHLNPQLGEKVFDLHQTVVSNLAELIVDRTQLDYINNLLLADRTLAVVAMRDAGCTISSPAAPTNNTCVQAAEDLLNGDNKAAAGDYGAAIDRYRAAWSDGIAISGHN